MVPSPPFPNSALLCSGPPALMILILSAPHPLFLGVSPCRSTRRSWGLPSRLPLSPTFPVHHLHHSPPFPSFPVPTLAVPCPATLSSLPDLSFLFWVPIPGVLRKTGLSSLPDPSFPFRVPTVMRSAQLRSGLRVSPPRSRLRWPLVSLHAS